LFYILKNKFLYIVICVVFIAGRLTAQLSPGPLANGHKDLEGMSKCTQCHDIGNKATNDKCLSCHKEIKSLIDRNRGYHVSNDVKGKDCIKCHSDHHGRNFDMTRFDEKNFNHNLASYELTGAHTRIDCRKCHMPDLVGDPELKKRKETFLGLDTKCNACHKDVHQKTLGNDCAKCHTTEKFAPATKFNHDKSDFALIGKHKTVQCIDCHQKETRSGETFQKFSGVAFKNCNNCHKDPHNEHLGTNCKECHSEQSFTGWAGLNRFNHAKTLFPLKGKHKQAKCQECHQMAATPLTVFQDRLGVKTENCSVCHKDVHEGSFGTNCAECHSEDSFRKGGSMDNFNHNRTRFALEGKHETVDCKKCHKSEHMTDPVPHNTCAKCHTDYHEGQFADHILPPDCAECHTVNGFSGSTFTLELHAKTKFKLEGAHVATPCFACHKQEEKWKFRGIGQRCVDCHKDVHNAQIADKWYPNKACEQCHQTSSWQDNKFDHSKTAFALKGVHAKQNCRDCHVPEEGYKYGKFAGLHAACYQCHEDEHNRQFDAAGVTDCSKCHGNDNWNIKKFNHDKTNFKLEGKHANVNCAGCHQPITVADKTFVKYKFENFDCVVCHK
jgi:hypothetical protein